MGYPLKTLVAFERVKLAVGEEKTVTFELTGEDLQLVDATARTC